MAPPPIALIVPFVMTIVPGTPSAPGRATIEAPVMARVDVRSWARGAATLSDPTRQRAKTSNTIRLVRAGDRLKVMDATPP